MLMTSDSSKEPAFTRRQDAQIRIIPYLGFLFISIGRTLRWESSGHQYLQEARDRGQRVIFAFWHNRILTSTWYWRNRGIVAMTSMNLDGEYIARVLRMYGYEAARGSSSRGGLGALIEMERCLAEGKDVAFTVDGPRGPCYLVKPGAVLLAKRTGCPILCFHISSSRHLQMNSWDRFQIPAPFSRAVVLMAPLIWVPPDADMDGLQAKQREMQQVLDRLRMEGDSHWPKHGPGQG
jgi:lysophospholipid acyltransferase (LPLAT)-like uncharacterized protein